MNSPGRSGHGVWLRSTQDVPTMYSLVVRGFLPELGEDYALDYVSSALRARPATSRARGITTDARDRTKATLPRPPGIQHRPDPRRLGPQQASCSEADAGCQPTHRVGPAICREVTVIAAAAIVSAILVCTRAIAGQHLLLPATIAARLLDTLSSQAPSVFRPTAGRRLTNFGRRRGTPASVQRKTPAW